jgi:hypothetical protein
MPGEAYNGKSMRKRILDLIQDTHLAKRARNLLRKHRITVSVIEGMVRGTQDRMRVLLLGAGIDRSYLLHLVFGDDYSEIKRDRLWRWKMRGYISHHQADLLIAIRPGDTIAGYLHGRNVFEIPLWVCGEIDFETAEDYQNKSRNVKTDLRRIRKNNLEYTVTKDPRLFDLFYHDMHVPHMKRVHKEGAFLLEYEEMKNKMSQAELLLIKKDDTYIAGNIILYENEGARAWTLGVKDGDPEYVKKGALSAVFYFRIEYLRDKGLDQVHIGSSRGFLKDGSLQYKKKWGMHLTSERRNKFLIKVLKPSKAVNAFLVNNPFIQRCNNELYGVYFLEADKQYTEDELREIYKSSYIPGMKKLNLYHTSVIQDDLHIPDDLQEYITVKRARMLFNEKSVT